MENQSSKDMESISEKDLAKIIQDSQIDSNLDIDKLLNDKAQKNRLSMFKVKSLIKNVIMNPDVATMLRQTLDSNVEANCLYEPKLTRAKIREMSKNNPSISKIDNSECKLLIDDKALLDDSDDEEYQPKIKLYSSEVNKNETKCINSNKLIDSNVSDDSHIGISENNTMSDTIDKETIYMRTRSKLSLSNIPLEVIEQAFIPPDFTPDMYDVPDYQDEWVQFLNEFTQPLEFVQNEDLNDTEDPEYNILFDDDIYCVDEEEFRMDKSVKITKKEYTSLFDELSEYTDNFIQFNGLETDSVQKCDENKGVIKLKNSNISNNLKSSSDQIKSSSNQIKSSSNQTKSSSNQTKSSSNLTKSSSNLVKPLNHIFNSKSIKTNLNEKIVKPKNFITYIPIPYQKDIIESPLKEQHIEYVQSTSETCMGITPKQIILLKYQLTQHVQLLTQNYILCNKLKNISRKIMIMLRKIDDFTKDKLYVPTNISTALCFIKDWNKTITKYKNDFIQSPSNVKQFMYYYKKPVFLFPELLPSMTNKTKLKMDTMKSEEERFLVSKIDYVFKRLKESPSTKCKYKQSTLTDLMPIIIVIVHKRWFKHRTLQSIRQFITHRKNLWGPSIIKNYLTHGIIEKYLHVIDLEALLDGNCLYSYDIKKFSPSWRSSIKKFIL